MVSFIKYKDRYLTKDLMFTKNMFEGVVVTLEYVSSIYNMVRIKIQDKFLSIIQHKVTLDNIANDSSLFILKYDNSTCYIYSIYGTMLSQNEELILDKSKDFYDRDIQSSIYLEYNIMCNLVNEGIISIPCMLNKEIHTASEIIHKNPHSRISNLFNLNEELFWTILSDPNIHKILKCIFPDGYHCTTFSSNNLRKGNNKFGWHCDYPYHTMNSPYPKDILGVQVIWTLDDFTEENGATFFVPYSHKTYTEPNIMENTVINRAVVGKGNIIIYLGNLWHSQGINYTDNDRGALLANFGPLYVESKDKNHISEKYKKDGKIIFE